MMTANLLLAFIVATIVGCITGMVLGGAVSDITLAMISGFLGVIASAAARNIVMARWEGLYPNDASLPAIIIMFSAVASLAGGLAAYALTQTITGLPPALLGLLAGALSSVLMAMLMITYHMNPDKPQNLIE